MAKASLVEEIYHPRESDVKTSGRHYNQINIPLGDAIRRRGFARRKLYFVQDACYRGRYVFGVDGSTELIDVPLEIYERLGRPEPDETIHSKDILKLLELTV